MDDEAKVYSNIERLGDQYVSKNLTVWDSKKLEEDWWESLKFFFHHSFMRGRSDTLSYEYVYFTLEALEEYLDIRDDNYTAYEALQTYASNGQLNPQLISDFKKRYRLGNANSLTHPSFREDVTAKNPLIERLITAKEVSIEAPDHSYLKSVSLGNDSDIIMVLDVLRFVAADGDHQNIVTYITDAIKTKGIRHAYLELVKLRQIGDKLASFIIRDIILLNPELETPDLDYMSAFPVDTWVNRIAKRLQCYDSNLEKVKKCFISNCKRFDIEPCKFAAGLWFLGTSSLDILLTLLEREDLNVSK